MAHLFVENLTHIDCSLLDGTRGLAGASWMVDVELLGELDEQGMVLDFSKVKKQIKTLIDEHVDHKLLVPANYSQLSVSQENNQTKLQFTDQHNQVIIHSSPACAIALIEAEQITEHVIADFLIDLISPKLPSNVNELRMKLRKEQQPANYYCYSHGLKKHDGNCQRIAHGHRSKVYIWQDGNRSNTLEQQLAERWQDIYLATEDDITNHTINSIQLKYVAPQGAFEIELPSSRVHLVPEDTTVECLAEHISELFHHEHPNSKIKVQAFEGINKGAIATSAYK